MRSRCACSVGIVCRAHVALPNSATRGGFASQPRCESEEMRDSRLADDAGIGEFQAQIQPESYRIGTPKDAQQGNLRSRSVRRFVDRLLEQHSTNSGLSPRNHLARFARAECPFARTQLGTGQGSSQVGNTCRAARRATQCHGRRSCPRVAANLAAGSG
jgi:hypothetical protein